MTPVEHTWEQLPNSRCFRCFVCGAHYMADHWQDPQRYTVRPLAGGGCIPPDEPVDPKHPERYPFYTENYGDHLPKPRK